MTENFLSNSTAPNIWPINQTTSITSSSNHDSCSTYQKESKFFVMGIATWCQGHVSVSFSRKWEVLQMTNVLILPNLMVPSPINSCDLVRHCLGMLFKRYLWHTLQMGHQPSIIIPLETIRPFTVVLILLLFPIWLRILYLSLAGLIWWITRTKSPTLTNQQARSSLMGWQCSSSSTTRLIKIHYLGWNLSVLNWRRLRWVKMGMTWMCCWKWWRRMVMLLTWLHFVDMSSMTFNLARTMNSTPTFNASMMTSSPELESTSPLLQTLWFRLLAQNITTWLRIKLGERLIPSTQL